MAAAKISDAEAEKLFYHHYKRSHPTQFFYLYHIKLLFFLPADLI
jgi:hypothetical protein